VEYHFEPSMLHMIGAMHTMGELTTEAASNLLLISFSEDLLLSSIQGRAVNLRPNDDSLILNQITWAELNQRWTKINNRNEALEWIQREKVRLAVKMPNLIASAPLIKEAMPDSHLVIVLRDGHDVVRSILKKRWVVASEMENQLWPYIESDSQVQMPYWVPEEYRERWDTMSEESRACLTWLHHAQLAHQVVSGKQYDEAGLTVIKYEDLLEDPGSIIDNLSKKLDLQQTHLTDNTIRSVHKPPSMKTGSNQEFYPKVDEDILAKFIALNQALGYP